MNAIMPLVTTFIAVSIILGIGVIILAGTSSSINCDQVPNADGSKTDKGTAGADNTGWRATCDQIATQSQSGYALLIVTLIIIAAITILIVVRML